ncbi:DUF2125 domain-containing protein [Paracoccus kondratievae]|nr:DUF2125 domain-containing protein [Paracoccus kondratievae]
MRIRMRRLLVILALSALILGGIWLGGETLLARQLEQVAAEQPSVELGGTRELREAGRIGVRVSDLRLRTASGTVDLPWADLWLNPLRLTEMRLTLPPQVALDPGAGPLELGLADASARLSVKPLQGFGVGSVGLTSGPVSVDGAELAKSLQADARLTKVGQDAPQGTAATYDLDLRLAELEPGFAALQSLPGRLSLNAAGKIWLDALPAPASLAAGPEPLPLGLRLDSADIQLGKLRMRVMGRIVADDQGYAAGQIALYTADAEPLLQVAADAGLISPKAVVLAGTILKNIATLPLPDEDGFQFPPANQGELRLPLTLSGGKMSLGPVPLGPAPVFPRR